VRTASHYIPEGDPGIERTLREMRRLSLGAVKNPKVIAWAQGIVRHVPERNVDAEAAAFLTWVRAHTRYTADPVGVELIKTPAVMLSEYEQHNRITADCDEQVTLLAAGLNIVGVETRFVVVAAAPGSDEFTHVLMEYLSPVRGWVSMDPIVRGTGPGWFPPTYSRLGRYGGASKAPHRFPPFSWMRSGEWSIGMWSAMALLGVAWLSSKRRRK